MIKDIRLTDHFICVKKTKQHFASSPRYQVINTGPFVNKEITPTKYIVLDTKHPKYKEQCVENNIYIVDEKFVLALIEYSGD